MPCQCIYLTFVFALTQNFSAKGLQFSNPVVNFHHYLTEFTVTFEAIFQPLWISLSSWIVRFHCCLFFFPPNYSVPVSHVGSSSYPKSQRAEVSVPPPTKPQPLNFPPHILDSFLQFISRITIAGIFLLIYLVCYY